MTAPKDDFPTTRIDGQDTAHHAWHSPGQFPETCDVCRREAEQPE